VAQTVAEGMTARHILIPIHDFNAGGTEAIAFRLAAAWLEAGRRVTILAGASDGPMRARVPEGVAVHILSPARPRSPVSRLFLGAQMAAAGKALDPDVLFIPGNFHFILATAFKRALPRVPIIAKISNPLANGGSPVHKAALRWWTRGIDLLAAMAPGLESDAGSLLPGRAVTTIHDPFIDDNAAIRAREGRPDPAHPLRLLAIGRLEPQKDFRLAIDTLAVLRRQREASLTILGEGSQRAALEAHIAACALQGHVDLKGHVDAIAPHIDAADMLLITSRYEGGPAVAIEALLHGMPFAATDCSHLLRELVSAEPSLGILSPVANAEALVRTIQNRANHPFPTAQAIESAVRPHRMRSAAARYLNLFDSLAE
jgi:glycosyltransferase involved in cell wall biosynthesis